jgi:hypothetical protein
MVNSRAFRNQSSAVFSTCLHCHAPLGANDSIEHFPVGARVAFDGERGRLWAVCARCHRWNLAPIEERWEALEACEQAYRTATQRVSTDNIALARLRDGTDLVRIGRPLLPEFAAWRYGPELRRRARRAATIVAATSGVAAVATVAKLVSGSALAGSGAGVALGVAAAAGQWGFAANILRRRLPEVALREVDGRLWGISSDDMWLARLGVTADQRLRVTIRDRPLRVASAVSRVLRSRYAWDTSSAREPAPREVVGDEAMHLLRLALPVAHRDGGSSREVREAVAHLESAWVGRSLPAEEVIARWLTSNVVPTAATSGPATGRPFRDVPAPARLAAEMALHDDDERRALAGELGALYARWEEAERIARIADGALTRIPARE